MDLGGNAPVIVLADSDLDDEVKSCVSGGRSSANSQSMTEECDRRRSAQLTYSLVREGYPFDRKVIAILFDDEFAEASCFGPISNDRPLRDPIRRHIATVDLIRRVREALQIRVSHRLEISYTDNVELSAAFWH